MTNFKQITSTILAIIIGVFVVDFLAYLAWTISGQTPVDGFYLGAITNHILSLINL